MARPAKLPPTKPVGMALSREVVAALDEAVKKRGLNKRQLVEIALRRELDLPDYPDLPDEHQGALKLPA
ncbi:ribbon-helix-helix protein, CopG family (plasmid) [Nocardia sp. CA-135953]|uniref:ribbon-helix-helix protein, CopG family n=1 Tax=Nocardia sp. CA-135953 TaxID=3239978 RepID=UPI003D99A720